ncbi:HAD family phosphatase [Neobacillus sp. MM2021_6]|uniref:HAD family hydrolase n=1 Tax=Bacillaceae TaxID=186817 RepID=UPI00140CA77D|nr:MULTISPECIES: HAD family hydrolase [Bacillaceae]MBO0962253.1 HAD family phosphatase [Neobacillus sp. MM2021_6]NHC18267.1 HAD family phosphatase [Bacillus sp. MM2020_4]
MKCISIDLDGTLLNSDHEVTEENVKALNELQEQGHCLIMNTGRAYTDVIKLKAIQNMEVPLFCVNGSVLYTKTRELLFEATLPISTYKEIFSILKGLGVGILVYTNHGGFPSTLPPLHGKTKQELDTLFQEFNYDAILEKDNLKIYKLIALVHQDQLDTIAEVKAALAGNYPISTASSFPNNVEITSSEAHKGKALLRYQDMMGLSFDEIIAFGDGGNDLAQFEVATTSVAMGNAPSHVQQKADIITKTNDEDGFAYAVRHLLPLLKSEVKITAN